MSTTRKTNPPAKRNEKRFQKNRKAKQKISPLGILGFGLLAGLIILVIVVVTNQGKGAVGQISGVRSFANLDRGHTSQPVNYAQNPPVGGQHNPAWQNCGVYSAPISNENAVHSLEHGVVWITYQSNLPADQVEQLQTLTRQSGYRLLSPYPDLPSKIVASAWGYQLQLDQADDPRLLDFIRKYEQNPEGPEPGAPCTGGVGNPG